MHRIALQINLGTKYYRHQPKLDLRLAQGLLWVGSDFFDGLLIEDG